LAVRIGRKGGQARAKKLTKSQRYASALHAITIRWARAKLAQEITT